MGNRSRRGFEFFWISLIFCNILFNLIFLWHRFNQLMASFGTLCQYPNFILCNEKLLLFNVNVFFVWIRRQKYHKDPWSWFGQVLREKKVSMKYLHHLFVRPKKSFQNWSNLTWKHFLFSEKSEERKGWKGDIRILELYTLLLKYIMSRPLCL